MKLLKSTLCALTLAGILTTTGCSLFKVYTIDLPQGTPITQVQAQKIRPGMTREQVMYLVGSPAIQDTLAPNRWDYVYDYNPGTYGEREGRATITNASQHMVVYFNDLGVVERVEGVDTLPATRQTTNNNNVEEKPKWYWPF